MTLIFRDVNPFQEDDTFDRALEDLEPQSPPAPCALDEADPERCRGWAEPTAPVPLCREHLVFIRTWVRDRVYEWATSPFARKPTGPIKTYVYFIRKHGLIKIGWTCDMETRMKFHKPDEVLHFEPGSQKDEFAVHKRFAHLRVPTVEGRPVREWFRPEEDLLAYIEKRKLKSAGE